jgi:GxxExxY protein
MPNNRNCQSATPVIDKGDPLDIDLRMDLVVEDAMVVELKSVQALLPVHEVQMSRPGALNLSS